LLVAEPMLADPNFHRTVVLIIDHSDDGALGVVLNRAGDVPVREVVPTWAPYVTDPANLFVGGPVSREAAICLARCPRGTESSLWSPLSALVSEGDPLPQAGSFTFEGDREIGVLDLHGDPTEVRDGEVPVFWACGVTPQAVALQSKPPLVITHSPGHMFVTDVPIGELV
jgi:hypothetical protein